jgi:hypothetical protein
MGEGLKLAAGTEKAAHKDYECTSASYDHRDPSPTDSHTERPDPPSEIQLYNDSS